MSRFVWVVRFLVFCTWAYGKKGRCIDIFQFMSVRQCSEVHPLQNKTPVGLRLGFNEDEDEKEKRRRGGG